MASNAETVWNDLTEVMRLLAQVQHNVDTNGLPGGDGAALRAALADSMQTLLRAQRIAMLARSEG